MPELPEVETIRLELINKIQNKTIVDASLFQEKSLSGNLQAIVGKTIKSIIRRGKYLLFDLDGLFMIFHLRMSGRILMAFKGESKSPYLKACFTLDDESRIDFIDVRKFGRITITDSLDTLQASLGVEPISDYFTLQSLMSLKEKKAKTALKSFLLDQSLICGIGNIYADEICFEAALSPFIQLKEIDDEKIKDLFFAIKNTLKKAIASHGTSLGHGLSNFKTPKGEKGRNQEKLSVYAQEGLGCLKCSTKIQKVRFKTRGTHFCPKCQGA
jgi:formamidopyrimidine-DNA glycosylase